MWSLSNTLLADIFESAERIFENHSVKGGQTFQTEPYHNALIYVFIGFRIPKKNSSYQQSGGCKCTSYVLKKLDYLCLKKKKNNPKESEIKIITSDSCWFGL